MEDRDTYGRLKLSRDVKAGVITTKERNAALIGEIRSEPQNQEGGQAPAIPDPRPTLVFEFIRNSKAPATLHNENEN